MTSLEEYWGDIRLKSLKDSRPRGPSLRSSVAVASLAEWINTLQSTTQDHFRVLSGTNLQETLALLEEVISNENLLRSPYLSRSNDPVGQLLFTFQQMRVPSKFRIRENLSFRPPHPGYNPLGWDLLWCLVAHRNVILTSQLRDLVTNKDSPITEFYKALVEIRFEAQERKSIPSIEDNVVALGRWLRGGTSEDETVAALKLRTGIKGDVHPWDRINLLLFTLSLAKDNQLLEEFVVWSSEMELLSKSGARGLNDILRALGIWFPLGCPLNFLLGWRATSEDRALLRKLNHKLLIRFQKGSAWAYRAANGSL